MKEMSLLKVKQPDTLLSRFNKIKQRTGLPKHSVGDLNNNNNTNSISSRLPSSDINSNLFLSGT